MKRWFSALLTAFLWSTLLLPTPARLAAQSSLPKAPSGPTPKAKDGKPDLSGVWLSDPKTYANIGQVSLKPAMQKLYDERAMTPQKDPVARCLPTGVPRITAEPFKIMQRPNLLLMMFEGGTHSFRQIFLDRTHPDPDDWDASWMGHSIGKWEGDTLVVDTVGTNDLTWLNSRGMPHSEKLHVIERYTRPDLGHLNVSITMEDPETFTKPVTFQRQHILSPNREIREYVCNEKSIEAQGLIGIR